MGCSSPSTVASAYPTVTITTSAVSLSAPVPSGMPTTLNIPSLPKSPMHRPSYKTWAVCFLTPVLLSSPVHSDWSLEEDWDGTKQKERERISETIRREDRKIADEERKRNEKRALSNRACVPGLLNDEPNLPFTNPPAQAPEKKGKTQDKQKDHVTDYYPPVPYMWPVMKWKATWC